MKKNKHNAKPLPSLWKTFLISMVNPLAGLIIVYLCVYVLKIQNVSSNMLYIFLIYIPSALIIYFFGAVLKAYAASLFNKISLRDLILYQYETPFVLLSLCPVISFGLAFYFLGFGMAFFFLFFLLVNVIVQSTFEVYMVFTKNIEKDMSLIQLEDQS